MTETHVIRWLAPALLAFSLLAGTWAPIVSCRPRPASAVAEPPGGHTIRLAVASEPGVPEALPRLLMTLLRQELSRAGLSPAEVDQPGSLGTIAILLQNAPLPPGQVAANPPAQKPPASKHARRMAQDGAGLSSRATHPPLRLQIRSPGSGHDSLFSRRIGRCCSANAFRAVREETRRRLSLATGGTPPPSQPLWPGTAAHEDFLDDSLLAGLRWLLHDALDPGKPALSDHLQVFLILSRSARDPALRRLGGEVGPMLARRFLSRVTVPRTSDGPARLCDLAAGIHFVKAFGVHVPERLERA
ncbi:MAG: hypothetical protein RBU30_26825, partial [Polyangia bacterium]|nr:hypothetical protein [Polyangia bacterium]